MVETGLYATPSFMHALNSLLSFSKVSFVVLVYGEFSSELIFSRIFHLMRTLPLSLPLSPYLPLSLFLSQHCLSVAETGLRATPSFMHALSHSLSLSLAIPPPLFFPLSFF